MFHYDTTAEDTRLIAESKDGINFDVRSIDNLTGKIFEFGCSALEFSMILQFMLDINGEPAGFEEMYKVLNPIFANCPNECRPIP